MVTIAPQNNIGFTSNHQAAMCGAHRILRLVFLEECYGVPAFKQVDGITYHYIPQFPIVLEMSFELLNKVIKSVNE